MDLDIAPGVAAAPVPPSLCDAVFNLVDNAIDASSATVAVSALPTPGDHADGCFMIQVRDDGPGLADAMTLATVVEPFVTTKHGGTGMGLAIADALVDELGGTLAHRRDGGWTSFAITLPLPTP